MSGVFRAAGNVVSSVFGGSSGGSGAQQTSSTSQLDPQIRDAYLNNVRRSQAVANQLGVRQFAGPNQDSLNAADMIRNMAFNGPGYGTVNQAAATANRLQNTGPMFINAPQAATAMTGSVGYGATDAGATGYNPMFGNAAQLQGSDIANYMNPFIQQVANSTIADANRARQIAQTQNQAQAVAARAFGGSRQAIQQAETDAAFDRNLQSTLANLYSGGFQNAQTAAQQDVANRQNMILANLGFGNQAGQFGASAANTASLQNAMQRNQAAQFGASAANQASLANQAALNNMGQFNANLGMQANQANQQAFQNNLMQQLNAAQAGANIGQTQQNLGFTGAERLAGLGSSAQEFAQAQLDAVRNLPLEQQQIINTALGLNPAGGSGGTTTSSGSTKGKGIFETIFG